MTTARKNLINPGACIITVLLAVFGVLSSEAKTIYRFRKAVGKLAALKAYAEQIGQQWIQGVSCKHPTIILGG